MDGPKTRVILTYFFHESFIVLHYHKDINVLHMCSPNHIIHCFPSVGFSATDIVHEYRLFRNNEQI